jgi:hypothetical protein
MFFGLLVLVRIQAHLTTITLAAHWQQSAKPEPLGLCNSVYSRSETEISMLGDQRISQVGSFLVRPTTTTLYTTHTRSLLVYFKNQE